LTRPSASKSSRAVSARLGVPVAVCHGSRRLKQAGQGIIEYGLILAIMAIVCVVSLLLFGDQLSSLLSLVAAAV
jgi:Flp pilus assembly pilin Flp